MSFGHRIDFAGLTCHAESANDFGDFTIRMCRRVSSKSFLYSLNEINVVSASGLASQNLEIWHPTAESAEDFSNFLIM